MRKREFDPEIVVKRATELFRRQGYLATSIDDLVKHTGVSRYGLYEAFGDKKGLFLASLDSFRDGFLTELMKGLETQDASMPEIIQFFKNFSCLAGTDEGKLSCLMSLTVVQLSGLDPLIDAKLAGNTKRLLDAFDNALANAKKKNEISDSLDVDETTVFLAGLTLGLASMLRAGKTKQTVDTYVRVGLKVLQS
jgi:TetR/AcrR family transcriptional repressor of nem operon